MNTIIFVFIRGTRICYRIIRFLLYKLGKVKFWADWVDSKLYTSVLFSLREKIKIFFKKKALPNNHAMQPNNSFLIYPKLYHKLLVIFFQNNLSDRKD